MALNNAINSPLLGGIPGALPVTSGGTGALTLTGVLVGNGTSAVTATAQLGVAQGGTGSSSLAAHGVLVGNGTSAITALAELSDGQLLIGSTGNAPALASLTAGAGISITPGAGSITIAATGGSFSWNTVAGTSQSMAVNNGYFANNAGLVTLTLPAAAAVGDRVRVMWKGAGGWLIAQNASQTIQYGNAATTSGTGGSLASSASGDVVELVCMTTNNGWEVLSSQGNLTVV